MSQPLPTEIFNFQIIGIQQQKLTTKTWQTYETLRNSERERCRNAVQVMKKKYVPVTKLSEFCQLDC